MGAGASLYKSGEEPSDYVEFLHELRDVRMAALDDDLHQALFETYRDSQRRQSQPLRYAAMEHFVEIKRRLVGPSSAPATPANIDWTEQKKKSEYVIEEEEEDPMELQRFTRLDIEEYLFILGTSQRHAAKFTPGHARAQGRSTHDKTREKMLLLKYVLQNADGACYDDDRLEIARKLFYSDMHVNHQLEFLRRFVEVAERRKDQEREEREERQALAGDSSPARPGSASSSRPSWRLRPGSATSTRSGWALRPGSASSSTSGWGLRPGSAASTRSGWGLRPGSASSSRSGHSRPLSASSSKSIRARTPSASSSRSGIGRSQSELQDWLAGSRAGLNHMLLSKPASRSGSKISIGIRSHPDWFADEGKQSVQSQVEVAHHEQAEPPHKVIQKAIDAIAYAAAHRDAKEAAEVTEKVEQECVGEATKRQPDLKLGISASQKDYAGKQIGEERSSTSANERAEPSSKVKAAPEQAVQSCSSIHDKAEAPTAEREYLDLVQCKPTVSAHGNIEGKDAENPLSGESLQRRRHSAEPPSRLMHEAITAVSANPRLARPPNVGATAKMPHFEYFANEEGAEIMQLVGSACMFGEPVHADGFWSQVPQMETDRPPSEVSWSTGASLSRPPSATGAKGAHRYKFVSNDWDGAHSHHTGFWTPSSDSSSGTGNGSKASRSLRNPSNPSSSNPGKKNRPASATSITVSRGAIHSATSYLQSLRPASATEHRTVRGRPTRASSGNLRRPSSAASVSGHGHVGRTSGRVINNATSYLQTLSNATARSTRHNRPTSAASGNLRRR